MATPGDSFDGNDFLLPDLGEGLDEAELVEWCVEEGQEVEEFETMAKMETAKALVEVPAPRAGKIGKLHGGPGDVIKVGKPLVTFGDAGASTSEPELEKAVAAQKQAANVATKPSGAGDVFADEDPATAKPGIEAEPEHEDAGTVVGSLQPLAGAGEEGRPLATPAVRRLARDLEVDLNQVEGTGIGGRITAADVRSAAPASKLPKGAVVNARNGSNGRHAKSTPTAPAPREEAPSPVPTPTPIRRRDSGEEVTRIPFRGVRRTIANRLRESVDKAVHFTVMDEADVTRLEATRKKLIAATGHKVSLLPFACVAVARVLSGEFGYEMARLNSTLDEESGDILQHNRVHLGLAVDTSSGLMVPRIRNANTLGVMELGRQIAEIAAACRDRSIPQQELQGSTFSISNFGSYAGRFATPVINYPEAGILAIGRMREGVVVKDGMMGVGKLLPLSLTCDHRVIDGGTATMALNAVIRLLQDPDTLLPEQM